MVHVCSHQWRVVRRGGVQEITIRWLSLAAWGRPDGYGLRQLGERCMASSTAWFIDVYKLKRESGISSAGLRRQRLGLAKAGNKDALAGRTGLHQVAFP